MYSIINGKFPNSPADWCKNCGIYGKSVKFGTKVDIR